MGLCFSCMRRCQNWFSGPEPTSESDPLLNKSDDTTSRTRNLLEKVTDIFAALKSGKLPSQTQLDNVARHLLNSDTLTSRPSLRGQLSPQGARILLETRKFLQVLLIVGLEKNRAFPISLYYKTITDIFLNKDDDKLQDLLYHFSQVEVLDVSIEDDTIIAAQDTVNSLRQQRTIYAHCLCLPTSNFLPLSSDSSRGST